MISNSWPFNENHIQHTSASVTPTPHREHRRDREHGGRRPRQVPDGTTPNQLVLSPTPAHVKSSRRPQTGERGNALRDIGSVQPLAPTSRRASQQQRDVNGGHASPHPYAAPPNGNGYNRTAYSPKPVPHQLHMNGGSESFLYGQPQAAKNGTGSREETTIADPGMPVRGFDREQMQRVGERDEDGGHGQKGFWSNLCCSST